MTNKYDRSSLISGDLIHFSEALFLKFGVANGQYLVNNQNLRLEVRGNRERKPNIHS